MSYASIPNQPVIFREGWELYASCDCGVNDFKRLVDYSDGLTFQLDVIECDSYILSKEEQLLVWEYVEDTNIIESLTATAGSLVEVLFFGSVFHYFKLEVTVYEIEGTLEIQLSNSTEPNILITTAGTYTLYFNTTGLDVGNILLLTYFSSDFIGTFSRGNLTPLFNTLMLGVVDANDLSELITYTLPSETQTYFHDGKLTFDDRNYFSQLEGGCYRIAISEPCINTCGVYGINDGLFSYDVLGTYWDMTDQLNSSWNIVSGTGAIWTGTDGVDSRACLVNNKNLCNALDYNITIEINDINLAGVTIYIGSELVTTIYAAGTYSISGGAPLTGSANVIICAQGTDVSVCSVEIGRIIVELSPEGRQLTTWNFDRYSDAISLGSYTDSCKYAQVTGCIGQDAWNFDTSQIGGLSLSARFEYRKFQPQYDSDIEGFRYSSGRFRATYVDIKKKWRFNFGRMPEYLLDFFSIALFSDNFIVDNEDYYPAENELPTITYNDSDSYGEMNVELYKRKEKLLKTFCTDGDC